MKHIIAVISISLLFSQAPSNAKYVLDQGHGMDTAPGPNLSRDRNDFSLEFDGISNNVDCGSDSILGLTDQITIEGWVRPTAIDGWDATDDTGAPISAGLYLYTIQTKDLKETRKMVLLK